MAEQNRVPLTAEQKRALRTEIIDLIAEMKGPPFPGAIPMRTFELQLRQLHLLLDPYWGNAAGTAASVGTYEGDIGGTIACGEDKFT